MNSHLHSSTASIELAQQEGMALDDRPSLLARTPNTLQELVRIAAKRRYWVIAAAVIAVALGVTASLIMKPVFGSTATIELNKSSAGASGLDLGSELSSQVLTGGDELLTDLQTETSILQSDSIAYDVIQRLGLASQEPFKSATKAKVAAKIVVNPDSPRGRAGLISVFKSHLKVQPIRGTRLIEVTFEDADPKRAALIANTLIDSYKNQYLESHYNATSEASTWLTKQLADLKRNVELSEKKLTDFEKETGILTFDLLASDGSGSSGGQAHSVVIQKLDALNAQLTQAEANRIEKEAIYRLTKSGDPESILAISNDGLSKAGDTALADTGGMSGLRTLHDQQNSLKLALANATAKFGENNRHLKELQQQVAELDRQLRDETKRLEHRVRVDYELAKQNQDALRQQFEAQQQQANRLNGKAVELAVLSQEASSRKKLYEDLYTKLQEANVSAGIKATNITIVDPAWEQPNPIRPRMRRTLMFSVLFGVVIGLVLAFIVDNLDRTLTTPTQLEELTGRSVIATIPSAGSRALSPGVALAKFKAAANGGELRAATTDDSLWMLSMPRSAVAEACRSLRTSILLSRAGGGPQVVLVTSSVPAEGKTTLTVNLGVTFAQRDKRVLIIEADMRRPRIHQILPVGTSLGLSNLLTQTADLDTVLAKDVLVRNLDVIPAGPVPPLPSEILDSSVFDRMLEALKDRYDLILIDSPPATVVTDAIPLAIKSDGVVWLTRAGVATKPLVERSAEIVRKYRLPLIGFVMNGVDYDSVDYKYAYYGYSSSSGYYTEEKA